MFFKNYYNLAGYFYSYLTITPRIGALLSAAVMNLGYYFFYAANSLVFLSIIFLTFNIVFSRGPDFKTFKDMPAFLLIALLSVFAVSSPDQVYFWISGSLNYSWLMATFLFFIFILRRDYAQKPLFKDGLWARAGALLGGVFLGMINENLAPIALGACFCYAALCMRRGKKLPGWFWRMFLGIATGLVFLFIAPAHSNKLARIIYSETVNAGIGDKFLYHINHVHYFITVNFFLPVFVFLGFIFAMADRFKTVIKDEDFLLSAFFFGCALASAWALFFVPVPAARTFYPPCMLMIISFLFMCKSAQKLWRFDFIKFACLAVLLWCLAVLPAFAVPYFNLHAQAAQRDTLVKKAIERGDETVYLPFFYVLKGPTRNLTIMFFDGIIYAKTDKNLIKQHFGIVAEYIGLFHLGEVGTAPVI